MLTFYPEHELADYAKFGRRTPLNASLSHHGQNAHEDIGDYVAHLQFHMTLQARNLVPNLTQAGDSREQLLHETQAEFEKQVSRQAIQRG